MNEEFDFSDIPTEDDLESVKIPDPGAYHLGIHSWKPTDSGGKQVTFTVLAGNPAGNEKLTFNDFFNAPDPSHKDGGAFCRKRLAKLALVTGLIPASDLGKKGVIINWDLLQGRQLLGYVIHEKSKKENKEYVNAKIDGLEMYRVSDESVGHIPKHAGALSMLPPELRPQAGGQAPPPATPPQQPPATPPAQTPPPQAPPAQQPPKDPWANL